MEAVPQSGPIQRQESPEKLSAHERETILGLGAPIFAIVEQVREKLDRGDYGLIVGDDVSGRIPTLILAEVIKHIYGTHGHQNPEVRFIAGGHHTADPSDTEFPATRTKRIEDTDALVASFRHQIRDRATGSRVLFVTDTIMSGETMQLVLDAFAHNDLEVDVAAVSAQIDIARVEARSGVRVYAGIEYPSNIYAKRTMTGVRKQLGYATTSPLRKMYPDIDVQTRINGARAVAYEVAENIIHTLDTDPT